MPVKELRLALTVEDYERALAFYRDTLGLPVLEAWSEPAGHVTLLDHQREPKFLDRHASTLVVACA